MEGVVVMVVYSPGDSRGPALADAAFLAAEAVKRTLDVDTRVIPLATTKWVGEPAVYVNGLHIGSGYMDPQTIADSIFEVLLYSDDPDMLRLMAASITASG